MSQKSSKWAEEIWFNPQSPCKEVCKITHTYNPKAWNVETSGSPEAHKPECMCGHGHACAHTQKERDRQRQTLRHRERHTETVVGEYNGSNI